MSIFAAGLAAMFRDRNMAIDALHRAGGAGAGVPVRVMKRAPDRLANFGEGRFVTDVVLLDVQLSEVPDLAPGDTFEIGGEIFEVRSEPVRDSERLVWAAEARAL